MLSDLDGIIQSADGVMIANAIHDGTSSVMLSVETAIGRYPVESVTMMTKVEKSTEDCLDYVTNFRSKPLVIKEGLPDAVGNGLSDSNWIFTYYLFTDLGKTVWNVSKGRSHALIAVASSNQETLRKCLLY